MPGAGSIAAHLTMLQTPALLVANDFKLGFGVVPPVWTLSVEAGLYIVVPLVAAQYFRHPFVGLVTGGRDRARLEGPRPPPGLRREPLRRLSSARASKGRIELFYANQFPSWALAFASG